MAEAVAEKSSSLCDTQEAERNQRTERQDRAAGKVTLQRHKPSDRPFSKAGPFPTSPFNSELVNGLVHGKVNMLSRHLSKPHSDRVFGRHLIFKL